MSSTVAIGVVIDVEATLLDEVAGPGWVRLLLRQDAAGELYGDLRQFFEEER